MSVIKIQRNVLEKNEELAARNRADFGRRGLFAINLVSSPGSGKTSLLVRTLEFLKGRVQVAVIEGDVQTTLDADRVAKFDVPVVQIVTDGGCHLDAKLVSDALAHLDLASTRLLVIENVGNLVCPANYDLGEAARVVVASTTEGEDKPLKYPGMFRTASVLVINKIDLLPYVQCDMRTLRANALAVNPGLKVFETSCTTGAGIADWCNWLVTQVRERQV